MKPEVIEKRAVKAGVMASKKLGHIVTPRELLSVRVQTMPVLFRIFLLLLGLMLMGSAWFGWPSDSNPVQALEFIGGIFSFVFGIFGVRRTLSNVVDALEPLEFAGQVIELIADAVSGIDL